MSERDPDQDARRLAAEALAVDDPTGWFERLYAEAEGGDAVVPWDRGAPHRLLVEWAEARDLDGAGGRALVVGCGLGDDAEYVAGLGFRTVAFDVSEAAIRGARRRFPGSEVRYLTADLLDLPVGWRQAFDLVVEIQTVQSLPVSLHRQATASIRDTVAPGGTLIVIGAVGGDGPAAGPPWPLTRLEIDAFATAALRPVRIEEVPDTVPRWRAEFHRG